ncbi:MAG TPA: hypothetical protein VHF69_05930 [Candidatus Synoicihabitans sp.]|nr:hypothetical protein [Candidatus Synoicihabitans sp.]
MTTAAATRPLSPRQLKQIALLTLGALALYLFMRWLPTGTALGHADFRMSGTGGTELEFCDPSNPQFLPVVNVRSPVETRLTSDRAPVQGEAVQFTLGLRTTTGKAIGPVDLLETHTRQLHVMVVDPTLTDYQHLHPEPGAVPGEWIFSFTPQRAGTYRIFCDFTPIATARGLYASADVVVAEEPVAAVGETASATSPALAPTTATETRWHASEGAYRFALTPARGQLRAREAIDLALEIRHEDGAEVALGEVMGARAHLVAFDRDRGGFAHLHPKEAADAPIADRAAPRLTFQVMIPTSGRYVVWAQLNLDGREMFVPFWFDVSA